MLRPLINFLACLLMLAVPLQGIAASTKLFCKSGHHSQNSSHHATMQSHHAMSESHGVNDISNHGNHSVIESKASGQADGQCSVCGLCGNLSALPPSIDSLAESFKSPVLFEFTLVPPPAPFLEGPKRPPRLLFA
jgi:hypothetical protein